MSVSAALFSQPRDILDLPKRIFDTSGHSRRKQGNVGIAMMRPNGLERAHSLHEVTQRTELDDQDVRRPSVFHFVALVRASRTNQATPRATRRTRGMGLPQ